MVKNNNIFSQVEKGKLIMKYPFRMDLQLFADGSGASGGAAGSGGGGFSAAYVQELRDEAASWRVKLRSAEEELTEQKKLVKTANDSLEALQQTNKKFLDGVYESLALDQTKVTMEEIPGKIKEAFSKVNVPVEKAQDALKKSAFIASAVKSGIRKEALEDAFKLADFSNIKVDLDTMAVFPTDKDGNQLKEKDLPITGLDSLVTGLVKEKPWLVGKSNVGGSANPGGGSGTDDESSIGSDLGKKRAGQLTKFKDNQKHYFGD